MQKIHFNIGRKIACVGLLLVSLLPIVVAVLATVRHWVPLPYMDEWHTPGLLLTSYANGTLSFSDFFIQHNESRMVFPRLLYLALAKVHGWDVRDAMVVTLLEVTAICGLLFWLFLRTTGATAISALVAFAVTTFLAFSPIQYGNFLWGLLFQLFFPGLAVVLAAVVNLSRLKLGSKTIINLIIALFATYTFTNGMLLWILAIPLPAPQEFVSKRGWFMWYSLFAFFGIAAISVYFVNYEPPAHHPSFHFGPGQIIHYIILWLGGYFTSAQIPPFPVGVIVLVFWLVTSANAIILITTRGATWRHFYPWLLIGSYALTSSVITAVGRLGFGIEQALSNRYATLSLFSYLGLAGITFALYCYYKDKAIVRGRRWIMAVAIVAIALASPAWAFSFRAGQQLLAQSLARNSRLLCALEWIDVFPTNPDLELILPYPYVQVIQPRSNVLTHAKLLRCHLLSPRFLDQLKEPPPSAPSAHGRLEAATPVGESLVASGWTWLPKTGPKPDCVLIAVRKPNKQLQPLCVAAVGAPRPGIDRFYGKSTMNAFGFWSRMPSSIPAEGIIEAWAVDTTSEIAWPLAGAVRLHDSSPP